MFDYYAFSQPQWNLILPFSEYSVENAGVAISNMCWCGNQVKSGRGKHLQISVESPNLNIPTDR